MKPFKPLLCAEIVAALLLAFASGVCAQDSSPKPFEESDGYLLMEAEHLHAQEKVGVRRWHIQGADASTQPLADSDPSHAGTASGGAYLEALPDTRRTRDDKLVRGENFSDEPGALAVLTYRIKIHNPGRYYVWVRAYSTGAEDNSIHVGLDGEWPESGRRMQWCDAKHRWRWESKQRTIANHCGEEGKIYLDIETAGDHTVQFSMREDGFEFDQWLITKDAAFVRPPDGPGSAKN